MKMNNLPIYGGAEVIGDGLRFECQGCGKCCTGSDGYVFITADEGAAMAAHLGMGKEEFFSSMTRNIFDRRALVDAPNGDCVFLGEKGCAVYPARPYQCRSWPFWFKNLRSGEAWEKTGMECPGVGKGRRHSPEVIIRWINGSPFLKGAR